MIEPSEKKDDGGKYRQLALFSVIVAEVVVTPAVFGGVVYWLLDEKSIQKGMTAIAALIGLLIAFFRIYQMYKSQKGSQ